MKLVSHIPVSCVHTRFAVLAYLCSGLYVQESLLVDMPGRSDTCILEAKAPIMGLVLYE